ncbi:MAG: hypothetical protein J0M25_03805 [Flavobacteriales bacterium]|nr:hypothetical protein [Flavobacteriales bacterium]
MKKLVLFITALVTFNSCIDDDLDFNQNLNENFIELVGDLPSQTLVKGERYLIKGQVFVRSGATLTIEPGAVIFGDKASKGTLIIDKGGKIIAEGTAAEPIVFTSSQKVESRDRGDWGGLVILGNARVNQSEPVIEGISPSIIYGGDNDDDNSGILKYVRVEYAGIELTPNNETNSITLGGVGRGTTMEYCQVSYGGDDGFEWFGGTVNGKYLIAFGMWDDCFDIDFGWSGNIQFALSVRYPTFADQSGSNIIETDSGPSDNPVPFLTNGVISNLTGIGPKIANATAISGNYQHAIDMRRRTALTIANSVFVGMPRGIRMNQQTVYNNYLANEGALLNNVLATPTTIFSVGSGMTANATDVQNYWNANGNETLNGTDFDAVYAGLGINTSIFYGNNTQNFYPFNPPFEVTSGSLTSGASFTYPKLQNAYFSPTTFKGAFGATDWTTQWAEFVPNLKAY